MRKHIKGDILKFKSQYERKLFKKVEIKEFLCTYKNQGEINIQYQMIDGDVFEVIDTFQFFIH